MFRSLLETHCVAVLAEHKHQHSVPAYRAHLNLLCVSTVMFGLLPLCLW